MTAATKTQTTWPEASPPREAMYARHGIVASAHQYASAAGLEVLRHGGNAIDAAVATAAVLMTVKPVSGHLGGDAFFLFHALFADDVIALNGNGAAPRDATFARYQALGAIPSEGLYAATVPGVVRCWQTAVERYGTRQLSELLQPAIHYAEQGVPVTLGLQRTIKFLEEPWAAFPETLALFMPDGRVPELGETFRQPGLASSLRRIAEYGGEDFYTGHLATDIVSASAARGGLLAADDLAAHQTEVAAPLSIEYRGYTVYEQPPPSQGIIVLLALNILKQFDLASFGLGSAATTHLLLESLKLAFEDRLRYLGDPRYCDPPLAMLLSEEHAREQAARIDLKAASHGAFLQPVHPDTTYLCVADGQGTMVSYIHSLFGGCGVVLGDTGVLMNNRMLGFNLEPGHPNCLAPGKRPMHTLNEYLVQRDGQTVLVGGTPGGHWQVQTNLQVLTSILDFGLDIQQAIETPQFAHGSQMEPLNAAIQLDARIGEDAIAELRDLGHDVEVVAPWSVGGSVQLIARDPATGVYRGATEVRYGGGSVLGL